MTRTKLLIAALGAMVVLSLSAGSALARTRIEVTPGGTIRAIANGERRLTFESEAARVICDVTLEGSLHRLIAKAAETLAGIITRTITANARNSLGTATECAGLANMHIRYGSIEGTLPEGITGGLLRVEAGFLVGFNAIFFTVRCLFQGNIGAGSRENAAGIRRLRVLAAQTFSSITDLNRSGQCPTREEARLVGEFEVTPTQRLILLER
jgi:hypothetical protein